MKILYIGHFREAGGWSNAAIDFSLALDSVGIDVVCRDIKLTNKQSEVPDRIKELEQKTIDNVDYCIQNVLPHHLVATDKFKKNVAYFFSESTPITSSWISNLSLMDEVWVPNSTNSDSLLDSKIENPVRIVPVPCDISKFNENYDKLDMLEVNDQFKFYTICDLNSRKNIESIIKCFHSEFCNGEQVALVLKINKHGISSEAIGQEFESISLNIKERLRIGPVKDFAKEVIIPTYLSNDQINQLHHTCDCYISLSHGEAWSIPAFDAMAFGNTPICGKEGGPRQFIDSKDKNTGHLIEGVYDVCFHLDPAFDFLFTGREEWFHASESQAKKAMRYCYENRDKISRQDGLRQAQKFSYDKVGNEMKKYLSQECS
tara:strand:+ start:5578 stop:6699 length:1122 start_codon:yes stop_codon:yes gene_type:complete